MTECMVRILIAGDSNQLSQLPASELPDCAGIVVNYNYLRGGGALGYFLGGYVPPGTPNWHPVLKKISPKIDTPF